MAAPALEDPPPRVTGDNTSQAKQFGDKSYVKAVQQKHVLVNHEVKVEDVDGTQMVEIPDELLINAVPLWEDFLEVKFLDPAPHVEKIHIIVNKIWPLGNKNIKIDVFAVNERTVKFIICDSQTRSRILRRGMWNIAGIPMILSKWAPLTDKENEENEVKIVPMWVTLKNVPHWMYSCEGLGFIASSVGKPVRLHPETELCSNFEEAKVFVNANMTKPLPKTYKFCSRSGTIAYIEFSYPWTPTKCSLCTKWGHKDSDCSKKEWKEPEVKKIQENVAASQDQNNVVDVGSSTKEDVGVTIPEEILSMEVVDAEKETEKEAERAYVIISEEVAENAENTAIVEA